MFGLTMMVHPLLSTSANRSSQGRIIHGWAANVPYYHVDPIQSTCLGWHKELWSVGGTWKEVCLVSPFLRGVIMKTHRTILGKGSTSIKDTVSCYRTILGKGSTSIKDTVSNSLPSLICCHLDRQQACSAQHSKRFYCKRKRSIWVISQIPCSTDFLPIF